MTAYLTKGPTAQRLINIYQICNESSDGAISVVTAAFKDTPGFQNQLPEVPLL